MKDISVIIPVYKSTNSLRVIVSKLHEVFKVLNTSYEIILINDSPNYLPSCNTIIELETENRGIVQRVKMRKNMGQQYATIVGISLANAKYIVTMDDDLQNPPHEIIKMVQFIKQKNLDAVLAIPKRGEKKHHWFRNLGSVVIAKIDNLFLNTPQGIIKSSFRIIKNDVVELISKNYNSSPAVTSLLFQITHNVENIEVEHHSTEYSKSNYNINKLSRLFFNNIVHYSAFPLKMLGIMGLCIFLISIIFIIIIIIRKLLFYIDFPGYASTVILISFFGGLNLLGIGIIGEYLVRIIQEQRIVNLEDLYIEK